MIRDEPTNSKCVCPFLKFQNEAKVTSARKHSKTHNYMAWLKILTPLSVTDRISIQKISMGVQSLTHQQTCHL